MKRLLWVSAFLFVGAGNTQSVDLDSMTDEELNHLSEEQAADLPMFPLMQRLAKSNDSQGVELGVMIMALEYVLYDLRYYDAWPSGVMSDKLRNAIREFQRDLSREQTGTLLYGEFQELSNRHDLVQPDPIGLSSFMNVNSYGGYAVAEGTWIFTDGTKLADPMQTSKIECWRDEGVCREAIASVSGSINLLGVDTYVMSITKWSETEIVAEDDSARCVSYTLSLNLTSKQATKFRRNKGGESCDFVAQEPQILKLVEGFDISWKARNGLRDRRKEVLNKKYIETLELLEQKYEN